MIKNIVAVIYTFLKFFLLKLLYNKKFTFSGIQRFSPNTVIEVDGDGKLILGSKVRAHSGTRIRVRDNAIVKIGNDVAFNYNCLVTAHKYIEIGDGCEIGPGVLFYDHDHEFKNINIKQGIYNLGDVKIGSNVWIGANCIILRDTAIGDNCVIAAGSVVKGNVPANSILVQKKNNVIKKY